MRKIVEAYLDIETTGLFPDQDAITVIGIYIDDGENYRLVQLVGDDVTRDNLMESLEDVELLYTYNGSRFDLPFIKVSLGVDLMKRHKHRDLMFDCWRKSLYGGFKRVQDRLGIERQCGDMGGLEAIRLWWQYQNYQDEEALNLLLKYNEEDVVNLKALNERLSCP
jgi:uncharacterized protein